MSMFRRLALLLAVGVTAVSPMVARGATTDFRVLFDSDNNAATGCSVSGMSGVDHVLVTTVVTDTAASVTGTSHAACAGGILGAPTPIAGGWPAGYQPASGQLLVETRLPFSAIGSGTPHNMRIGIEATQGAISHTAITRPNGSSVFFPATYPGRRHSVGSPGTPRVMVLDGIGTDWTGIDQLFQGIAGGGSNGLRLQSFYGYADIAGSFLYFRFDANLSTDAPVAVDDTYVRPLGQGLTQPAPGVLANDLDPNGLPLTAAPVSTPAHGDVTLNPDGSFTYTPDNPGSAQEDSFQYKASNGTKESSPAQVTISVGDNTPPVITSPEAASVPEGETAVLTVTATDAEGQAITFSISGGADAGAFTINPTTGALSFNTAPDFENPTDADANNIYVVQVTATDSAGGTASQTVNVTVTDFNEEPSFTSPSSFNVPENTTAVGVVVVSDPEGASITYSLFGGADLAFFSINAATGALSFNTPRDFEAPADAGANNVYDVIVRASDGFNTIDQAVSVTVTNVNEPPSFTSGNAFSVPENTTAVTTVTTTDPEGNTITYSISGGADGGDFTINPTTGALAFNPAPNFEAPADADTNNIYIVQVAADDGPNTTNQTITVTVTNVNEAPTAVNDARTINEDTNINEAAPGLITNDSDPEGSGLTATKTSDPLYGVATVAASGAWTYQPNPNYNGLDSFTYTVSDGTFTSNTATVTITVTAVNDEPAFTAGAAVTVAEDSGAYTNAWATGISAGPADESAQTLSFTVTNDNNSLFSAQPAIAPNGTLTFTPALNANGSAQVSVTLFDSGSNAAPNDNTSATVMFTLTVTEVNDAPSAVNDANTTPEDTPLAFAAATLATNDSAGPANESGQTLTVTGVSAASAQGGTVTLVAGTITYTPPADYNGPDSFTYTVTDNGTTNGGADPQSAIGTVNITVTEVNDAPTANADNQTTAEDTPLVFAASTLTTNDSKGPANESGQTLTVTAVSAASAQGGTVTLVAGTITYTPPANYFGADSFTYTVTDDGTTNGVAAPLTANGTVNVTVTAVNDAPVLTVTGAVTHTEGGAATNVATAANITDVDDTDMESATIQITGNFASGQDVLSFTNTLNITGSFVGDTLTLTGTDTLANYIAALQAVQYTNTSNTPSALQRTLTWTVNDGTSNSNTQTSTVDVTATNDPPVNTLPAAQNTNEDTPLTLSTGNGNAISIADPDANPDDVQVTLNVTNGTVTLNPAATGALTTLTGDGTNTVVATGTVAEINAALDGMTFTPTLNSTAAASIQVVTDDLGNNPSGNLTDTDTLTITVTAVNDAPVLTVTGAVTHTEGGAATNVATAANITDVDDTNIESAAIQITGNFASGQDVLSFVNTPNITGSFVGDTLTLTGTDTLANYIAALQAVQYTNTSDAPSVLQRTLTWTVNDGDVNSNTQTTTLDVTATNDAPVNSLPVPQNTAEDTPLVLSTGNGNAISIADADANPDDVQVTLNVTLGTVTVNPAGVGALTSLTGDGTATVVATGTVAEINAVLNGLTYAPTADQSGAGAIQIVTDDLGNNPSGNLTDTDTLNITVSAVTDPPVLTVTGSPTFAENGPAVDPTASVNITDVDSANMVSATVQISGNFQAGADQLNFVNAPPIMGSFVGDTLTLTGSDTIANYIAALQSITFSNTSDNPSTLQRTLTWTVNDGAVNSNTQTTTVDVTATNDPPVNTLPAAQNTNEDTALVLSTGNGNAISIADPDANPDDVQVTLNVTSGTVTLNAGAIGALATLTGNGSNTVVATGTVANLNAALDGLTFTPTGNFAGAASIQVVTDDLGNNPSGNLIDTDTLNITVNAVNDPPVNGVPGTQTFNEDTTLTFSTGNGNAISVADVDVAGGNLTVTLTTTAGTMAFGSVVGLAGVTNNAATITGTGNLTDINNALQGLVFTPTLNINGPQTISFTTNDNGNTGAGGAQSDNDTINLSITAVNDAPVNTVPGGQTMNQDTIFTFTGATQISVADVDAGASTVQVTLTGTNGTVTLSGTTGLSFSFSDGNGTGAGDGTADATMTFRGTLTDVNSALNNLQFASTPGFFSGPNAQLDIVSNDLGNTGTGGAQTDSDSVSIFVQQVNQPPVNSVPGAQTFNEDTSRTFASGFGNLISISDPDAGVATVQVQLTVTNGALTLSSTAGLSFVFSDGNGTGAGDGTNDATMTFRGTIADINNALNFLSYTPNLNVNGSPADTLTIVTNDLGNTGPGGPMTDTDNVVFNITAVNDAPVLANPASVNATEDVQFSFTAGNTISVTDVDSGAGTSFQATLGVTSGTINVVAAGSAIVGGNNTNSVTITGTVADVNSTLATTKYTGNLNFNGADTLVVNVTDNGQTGAGGALGDSDNITINVAAVNDAPVNTVPGTQTFDEDTPRTFSTGNGNAISVADVDAGGSTVQLSLTTTAGTMTLSGTTGLSFVFSDGNGTGAGDGTADATMTFRGTLTDINNALQGMVFTPTLHLNGAQTISMTSSDLGNTGSGGVLTDNDTINLSITAVNDAPVNTLQDNTVSTTEDVNLTLSSGNASQISIADPDGDVNVQVTLTVTNGTLSTNGTAGLTFTPPGGGNDGTDDTTMVFTGTISTINARLNGLLYKPAANFYGAASVTILTNDQGNTGSGGAQSSNGGTPDAVAVTVNPVNDPPTTPSYTVANGNAHITHSGLGITISAADSNELKEDSADVDDHDPYAELTVQIVGGSLSPANATLTLIDASTGAFYFEPPGGLSGSAAASFQYQVCDNGDVGLGLAAQCSAAATVQFTITGTDTWFVDDTDAAGCGVNCNGARTKPFVGLNNAGLVARGTGDKVFAFSGTYNHGFTMNASELLVGQASTGAFDTVLGVSVPSNGTLDTRPSLSGAAVTLQNTLTAANSTTVRGFALSTGANKGYVANANTLTVLETSATAANTAVEITNGTTSNVSFTSTTSTGGTHGINLTNVSGTFAFGSGGLTNNTTAGFALAQNAANSANVTYGGNINPTAAGRAIDIGTAVASSGMRGGTIGLSGNIGDTSVNNSGIRVRNSTAGTLNLTGATYAMTTGATHAVELTTNPGATINFNPGTSIAINTTTGRGFLGSGGGTINVTGTNNTITTTNGGAFEVFGTAGVHMGGGYTWRSITATNGTDGISLQFHDGAFSVSGDGPDGDTNPDSVTAGGTITGSDQRGAEFIDVDGPVSLGGMTFTNPADTAGPDATVAAGTCGSLGSGGNNTGCFAGIHFDTVSNVTINTVNVTGSGQMGINGNAVSNLTMNTVNVNNCGTSAQEDGIRMYNLSGTGGGMTSVSVNTPFAMGLQIQNSTSSLGTAPSPFTITNSSFLNSQAAQGAVMDIQGGVTHVRFLNGSITGNFSAAIQTGTIAGTLGINIDNTSFSNNAAAALIQGTGGTTNYDIRNIDQAARGTGSTHSIVINGSSNAVMSGSIIDNQIGNASAGSGASCGGGCRGISVDSRNTANVTAVIRGNTVRHVDESGIHFRGGQGTSKLNITITGNLIQDPDNTVGTVAGIFGDSGVLAADENCVTAQIGGTTAWPGAPTNTAAEIQNRIEGAWGTSGVRVRKLFGGGAPPEPVFNLPLYDGLGVVNWITARNSFSAVPTPVTQNAGSGGAFTAATSCP